VLFAEPLPLFLPFFFAMATVLCGRLGRWRSGAQKYCLRCSCAANVQVPAAVDYDDYFPVAAALGYLIGTYGYVRRTLVRKLFATGRRRHRKLQRSTCQRVAAQLQRAVLRRIVALDKRSGKHR
jgi:hypothetical protein